jgi:hypothetical protein
MSTDSDGNVISLLEIRRRATDRRQSRLRYLAERVIDEADCDIDAICGASAPDIAGVVAIVADLGCGIDDPRNVGYLNVLPLVADEESASFIATLAIDTLRLAHSGKTAFNDRAVYPRCLLTARRVVSEPEYAPLFEGSDHD